MSKLSKKMYERCLNPNKVIWDVLCQDIRNVIEDTPRKQYYGDDGKWHDKGTQGSMVVCHHGTAYRIHPDTPHEDADMIECDVAILRMIEDCEYRFVKIPSNYPLTVCVGLVGFVGIVYELDGVQTVRTSIDAAFGVPKKVLFKQEPETNGNK